MSRIMIPCVVSIFVAGAMCVPALGQWVETDKWMASDAFMTDAFGGAVAVSGNRAVVGASGKDGPAMEPDRGAAYLFDAASGTELFKWTASDADESDFFGSAVAIHGDRAIIGAYENDDAGDRSGSAYLFDTTLGGELSKLTAPDAAEKDYFGYSVGISSTTAIVGAYGDDDLGGLSGSAYLFDIVAGGPPQKLTASNGAADAEFGYAVAVDGNTDIVGALANDNDLRSSGSY